MDAERGGHLVFGDTGETPVFGTEQVPSVDTAQGPAVGAAQAPLLDASGISVHFGGLHALADVDLAVRAGQITGLIGPNGAGKTTLFNVLTGLITPRSGSVTFAGHDVTRWPPHRRDRAGIARTFQRLELFVRMSVEDNLTAAWEACHPGAVLGLGRTERLRRVAEVMDLLDLWRIADVPAGAVPTGQGRMVELGRALCTDPRVLLLDEPSSGLDATETARFCEVLRAILGRNGSGEPAVLLVEHDMALVMEVCERITVLDFGRRIACGSPAEIRSDSGVRSAYLGETEVA